MLEYGSDRFDLPKFHHQFFPVRIRFWVIGGVMALPVIVMTIWQSRAVSHRSVTLMSVAAVIGVLTASFSLWASLWAGHKLTAKGQVRHTAAPIVPLTAIGRVHQAVGRWYQAVLEWLHNHPALGTVSSDGSTSAGSRMSCCCAVMASRRS